MALVFLTLPGSPNVPLKSWGKGTQHSSFKAQREQLFQSAYPGKLMLKRSYLVLNVLLICPCTCNKRIAL